MTVNINSEKWEDFFVSGNIYEILCTSTGAFPSSDIKWFINGTILNDTVIRQDENFTISQLTYHPMPMHHNAQMTCVAKNGALENQNEIHSSKKLNVLCKSE